MTESDSLIELATPPPELSPRIVPRGAQYTIHERGSKGHPGRKQVIDWRGLVLAAWRLSDAEQYTGTLPPEMPAKTFWAGATRAAGRMRGSVGIAVRGRQWWLWARERGTANRLVRRQKEIV